jgi:hypothetical protein
MKFLCVNESANSWLCASLVVASYERFGNRRLRGLFLAN